MIGTPNAPVVVTGGAGFLGVEVVRQLLAAGCTDVRVVDLHPYAADGADDAADARRATVRTFVVDLRRGDLGDAFAGAKTVLHLAACQYHTPLAKSTYDLPFFPVNVDGTRRVIEACARGGAKRLVFVSTNMVYGLPRVLPLTERHPKDPFGPYGKSKLAAEALVERAHGKELETAIVRPGLIVGPGRTGVLARVFDWVLAERPIWLIGDGANRYEMMSVEDVASLVLAAARGRGHGAYNCAAASVTTMREWVERIITLAGSRSRVVGIPGRPLKAALRLLEGARLSPLRKDQYLIADIDYYMDAGLARRELAWAPKWGGLDAIVETFRWYTDERGKGPRPRAPRRPAREGRTADGVAV
jgi:dTDP-glucose 4,6-dehydratase